MVLDSLRLPCEELAGTTELGAGPRVKFLGLFGGRAGPEGAVSRPLYRHHANLLQESDVVEHGPVFDEPPIDYPVEFKAGELY